LKASLPFEGLICRGWEIFPVTDSASDDHHSLALLIDGSLVAALKRTDVRLTPHSGHWGTQCRNVRFGSQTLRCVCPMSALPPKADIGTQPRNVCFVPKSGHCSASIDAHYSPESGGGLTLLAPSSDTEPDSRFQTGNGGSYDYAVCRRAGAQRLPS